MADPLESESAAALLSFKNGGLSYDSIKQEEEDIIMDPEPEEPPTLGPELLGLKRVGEETPPRPNVGGLVLNRRGMPARIRKKNRLFYDDDVVNIAMPRMSPKKTYRSSPKKPKPEPEPVTSPDKRVAQRIGVRLRNLLKLPKAHKWVCYEWFYSNIDKPLFEGDNDFMICLKESFPQLKTRKLTRVEWCKIRRMMGKPRRCSQSFFGEERRELEKKRQKIRLLQQRKTADVTHFKDLPEEIPLQLVIGTKVTARLRKPQDGLFTGSIDAVDTSNNTYRITFDRQGLGTHSIPDYEVLSNDDPEMITVSSFAQKFRPRTIAPFSTPPRFGSDPSSPHLTNDPLLAGSPVKTKAVPPDGILGGFPVKFLDMVVRLSKILNVKKEKITVLREMNSEAEKMSSYGEAIPGEFRRRYAGVLMELDKLNKDLHEYLNGVQQYCMEIAPEPNVAAMLTPYHLQKQSQEEANELVMIHNRNPEKMSVTNERILDLITDLTALMLQVKSLGDADRNAYELNVLQNSLEEIRLKLSPQNQSCFQNCVELHMQHIQMGLSQLGSLHPFMIQRV